MKRALLVTAALGSATYANAALTLQFANRWNLQEFLIGEFNQAVASNNGTVIAVGNAGGNMVLCKYDSGGNLLARRYYEQPGGGGEYVQLATSDLANGVLVCYQGSTGNRWVRFDSNLNPLRDGHLFPVSTRPSAMTTDGAQVIVAAYANGNAIVTDANFAGGNNFIFTLDNGPSDFVTAMKIRNGELVLVGGTGERPFIAWRNLTNGDPIRGINYSNPNWTLENNYRFNDLTIDADDGDILAAGGGRVGGQPRGVYYSVEFDGSGPLISETANDFIPARLAKQTPNDTWSFAHETTSNQMRVVRVDTDNAGIATPSASIPNPSPAPSLFAASSRIFASRGPMTGVLGQRFTSTLTSNQAVESTDTTKLQNIRALAAGPVTDTAYAVGFAQVPNSYSRKAKVALMEATRYWEIEESFFGFPNRSAVNSVEDAAGARYIVTTAQDIDDVFVKSTILKVNASGAVVWARPVTWANEYGQGTVVTSIALAPDGTIVICGYGGNAYYDDVKGYAAKMSASTGAAVWTQVFTHYGAGIEAERVQVAPDGGIYVTGRNHFVGYGDDGHALKLSSTGALLWQKNLDIVFDATDSLTSSVVTSNGIAVALKCGDDTARLRVLSSSTGATLWDRILPDPQGAKPYEIKIATGPSGTVTAAVAYSDGASRDVLGVYRLNPVTKATLLNTRFGAINPNYEVATLSTGDPIILDTENNRLSRLHPTNGTVTWHRNIIATSENAIDLKVDRLNNIYALMGEEQTPGVYNVLLSTVSPAGVAKENRRSAGYPFGLGIGLNDSVWIIGEVNTPNRSREASITRYTQTL